MGDTEFKKQGGKFESYDKQNMDVQQQTTW